MPRPPCSQRICCRQQAMANPLASSGSTPNNPARFSTRAEEGALLVNLAAAGAGVVVDAPAIWAHHLEILPAVVRAEASSASLRSPGRVGSTTRNADAAQCSVSLIAQAVTTRHSSLQQRWFGRWADRRLWHNHSCRRAALPWDRFPSDRQLCGLVPDHDCRPAVIFILFYRRGAL